MATVYYTKGKQLSNTCEMFLASLATNILLVITVLLSKNVNDLEIPRFSETIVLVLVIQGN